MAKKILTAARLRELFNYNPETGIFTWRNAAGRDGRIPAGSVAGSLDAESGYVRLTFDDVTVYAHRMAWLYVHGVMPVNDIDHDDRVRHHNWISNLRDATRSQNLHNQIEAHARSKSGVRGVIWEPSRKRWKVCISVGNKNRHVGRFTTIEAAKSAYLSAKAELL